ncbi:MAG TPA: PAS domain S-box protein [Flavitalea sp.]|nr:PAS domain S-box protein [Flavitalea sp.]
MSKRALTHKNPIHRSSNSDEELVFFQTDPIGIIIWASEQLSSFTGLSAKDLVGSSITTIASKKDHLKLGNFLKKEKFAGTQNFGVSLNSEKKARFFRFAIRHIPGSHSRNFLLNWSLRSRRDIHSAKRKKDFDLIRKMFDPNPEAILIYEREDYHILYANEAARRVYGFSEVQFSRLSLEDLFAELKDQKKPLSSGAYSCKLKDDKWATMDVFVTAIIIGRKAYQMAFTNEPSSFSPSKELRVNRRSEIHANLERDDSDAWQILDNAPEIFFKLDSKGNFVFVSNEFTRTLGYTKTEIQGKHFTSIVFADDLELAKQGFADIFQFGRAKGNVIFRVVKKSGGFDWVSTSGTFVFDNEGRPVHCIGFAQVITEIKQLVEKLEASEERYAAFINHSSEAIWRFETADPLPVDLPEDQLIVEFFSKGYLAECNDQMAKLYGFEEASDLVGTPLVNFIPVDDIATLDYFRGFIQAGFKLENVETNETDRQGNPKIFLNNLVGIVEKNQLMRVWGTQRDITEHKLAQQKARELLEQSENFFKSLISDSLDGIVVLDKETRITYAAESITNVLGFAPSEVIGKSCFEFMHPEDVSIAIDAFNNRVSNVKSPDLEVRFRSKQDEWLWMLVRTNDLNHHASINGLVVYFTNITQRKHTENILKESEKRFRHLADSLSVMIWVMDEKNNPIYVSKCWTDFTGVSLEKIINAGWKNIIHPEDYTTAIEQYKSYISLKQPFMIEYRVRSNEGDYKWVVDHGVPRFAPDGVFMGYIGSVIDIHYRKTAEEKLRYQAGMIENIRDAVISTDLDFNIISWNSMADEIYGFSREEAMGKNIRVLIKHEYFSTTNENVLVELYEKDHWEGEVYCDRKDGKRVYLFTALSFVKNDRGERIGLVGVNRDITQRYEAEKALRISEERYRSVVDALNEGIVLQDSQGKLITCNKSAKSIFGHNFTGLQFNVQGWRCIKENGDEFSAVDDPFTITMQTGKRLQGIIMGLQRPGDPFYWFSVNTEPIYHSKDSSLPDAVVTSFFDITLKKHQAQWLSLEKEVLEINAKPSATLKDTVDFYLGGIERIFPDMICSIFVLRNDKQSIEHLSAPSLPFEFSQAINGAKIGPEAGSCGAAIFRKQRVITTEINTDPLWKDYRALAVQYNLQSCWSFPILDAQNEVFATIAAFHKYPKEPTDKEVNIMEVACNLLRIIFENKKSEASLRLSNERYLLATKATHDAIYDWDIVEDTVYRGESFYSLFGYSRTQGGGLIDFLQLKLHPEDRERVVKSLKRFVQNKSADIWECEYRFLNASGNYVVVYDRGFLIFRHDGDITRLVGSMMDITERKELEKRLLKQEVHRQKLVAQAVVNAQEKERAEIGKELHDNVNQILSTARLYLELAKSDEKERISLIKRSYDNIYDAINEIRSISRSLVPPSIGDLGLIESIEDLVENIRATKKLYVEFCYGGDIDALLGQKQKLMLFRIIQEQVNNVLKHANASNIIIELMIDGHMINLAVSDDGKGFDFEEVKDNKGVGLQNIASRTELFNGKINIVTAPNKGCKLNIHVPISKT